MRTWLMALPLLAVCAAGSACSIPLKAKAPIDRPALDVPPPPPRVIEPSPVQDVPPEPVPDLPPVAPAPIKPTRPAQPRPNTSGNTATSTEPKTDAKPEATPATDPAPAPPPASMPQLRTPQTADGSEADKQVRTTLERAKSVLSTVNFNPLSNERKKAYNDAKNFIQLAEDALKQGNYVFAQGAATKAETLAHELAGR